MKRVLSLLALAATALTATAQAQDLPATKLKVVGGLSNLSLYNDFEKPFWTKTIPEASKGKITDVFLLNHPSGTKSARVSFENADDARKCVAEYNGMYFHGNALSFGVYQYFLFRRTYVGRLPMRLSVASALPVSTVFSRIQQPTGNSFQVSAAAPTAVPALTAINNLPVSNGNRGGLFGTALPKQQQQQPQQHHNAPHQGSRRVEVQSEQNNFKRERKEKVR